MSLLEDGTPELEAIATLQDFTGGRMPLNIIRLARDWRRCQGIRQEDMARELGISRPQLANAERQRFGLGRSPAARLREVIAASIQVAA